MSRDRKRFALLAALVLAGAAAFGLWRRSQPEPAERTISLGDPDDPEETLVPASERPAIWADDDRGVARCEVTRPAGRTRYDFDAEGRLVQRRSWRRRLSDPPDERQPWGVTRYTYGEEGAAVHIERASRSLVADDPYRPEDDAGEAWSLIEIEVANTPQAQWLHQRWTEPDREREVLYQVERGRLAMRSPLAESEPVPRVNRCLFHEDGRPLMHATERGGRVQWRYGEDGRLAEFERAGAATEPEVIAVDPYEGGFTIELDRYEGQCAEVVFERCSAVMALVPGEPLPANLLPSM